MDTEQPEAAQKPRVTNACEACRAAKVKCEASSTLGICRRCLDSKRECIFKAIPRTRRPRQSKLNPTAPRLPPPPGPSKTFTIDIPMPADDDVADSFETLREQHEMYLDRLCPDDGKSDDGHLNDSDLQSSTWTGGRYSALSTPPSSVRSRSVHGFSIRPQFNLESAEGLLQSFRAMLTHFPVLVLPDNVTVPDLARESPFVLLAILSAASGSRTLQGHTLYDEEFRKVLGLKFVAGGERSLELLQGLLVYCAWYPFHLRPNNRQALQYIRMAADIVRDLDLDQPVEEDISQIRSNPDRVAGIRAYLACYYLSTNFATAWARTSNLRFIEWTTTCCNVLDGDQQVAGDRLLAWLARMEHLMEEVSELRKNQRNMPNDYQTSLLMKGMETQLREWQSNMPPDISSTPTLTMSNLFTELWLYSAPLLKFPSRNQSLDQPGVRQTANRLLPCINILRTFYEYVTSLPPSEFSNFCGMDWDHFIIAIILGFRLSFPLTVCPEWDSDAARREINLGYYLDKLSYQETDLAPASNRPADVLSASKVVLGVVKRKWAKRLASINPPHPLPIDKSMSGCPMLDGSLDPYLELWDENFINTKLPSSIGSPPGATGTSEAAQPGVYHDLWATMTLGWTREGMDDIDFGNI